MFGPYVVHVVLPHQLPIKVRNVGIIGVSVAMPENVINPVSTQTNREMTMPAIRDDGFVRQISSKSLRLRHCTDKSTGINFLVDTGADVSIFPASAAEKKRPKNVYITGTYYDIRRKIDYSRFRTPTYV